MADSTNPFGLPPLGSNVPTPPPLRPITVGAPPTMAMPSLPKPPSFGGQDQSQQMMQQLAMGAMGNQMMAQMFPAPVNSYGPPTPNVSGIGGQPSSTVTGRIASPASATSTADGGSTDYRSLAVQYANQYGVPVDFFTKLIGQESGFNPNAVSPAGALGIAQVMPGTAQGWGIDPHDPVASLDAAAKNLKAYADANGGSWLAAAISYNAGPGAWATYQRTGWLPDETKRYVQSILGVTV